MEKVMAKARRSISWLLVLTLIMSLLVMPAGAAAETTSVCSVSVSIGGTNSTFKVPTGEMLNITWEFLTEDGIPQGWQMLVNDEIPGDNYTGIIGFVPTGARVFNLGKPEDLTFTPEEGQTKGSCTLKYATLEEDDTKFDIKYVDKSTGNEVDRYYKTVSGEKVYGYSAGTKYGKFEVSTGMNQINRFVTMNLKGYRIWQGEIGSPDLQKQTLLVGKDGVQPKEITMYVEVNHSTITDLHTQPVKFVCDGKTVYTTTAKLKNAYTGYGASPVDIELDLTAAAGKLAEMEYALDATKTYTVKCNNYMHTPEVTVIEVASTSTCNHDLDVSSTTDNSDGTHTGYCWNCDKYITQPHSYDEDGFCTVCYAEHKHSSFTYARLDETKHEKICVGCGKEITEAHTWDDGAAGESSVTYTCTLCNATKTESTSSFTYDVVDGSAWITGLRDETLIDLVIPNEIDGYTVTAIADNAFAFNKEITKVVIPDSVESIGEKAFLNCWALADVELGTGVTSIGYDAFGFAKALKTISIPDSVTTIGAEAFARGALTCIDLGKNVTVIGDDAFTFCESLAAINVDPENTAYSSNDGVLFDKSGDTLILYPNAKEGTAYAVPNGAKTIGANAFYMNSGLETVTLADSVTCIEEAAFSYSQISNIAFGSSLETIEEAAFDHCENLQTVVFPETLETIGKAAFYLCTSITEVVIPDSVTTIGKSAFQKDTGIKTVVLGAGVQTIGNAAFGDNRNLETFRVCSRKDIEWSGKAIFDIALDNLTVYGYCDSGLKGYCKTATTNFVAMHNYVGGVCTICGESYPDHEHDYRLKKTEQPTCTETGYTVYICTVCSKERTEYKNALGHTPGTPVRENEVPATTTAAGRYDEVVYCTVCKAELSRVTKVIPQLDDDRPIFPVHPGIVIPAKDPAFPFKDVPTSAWYYDSVKSAWKNDLINGVTGTEFRPDENMTVAQAIKLAAALHQMNMRGKVSLTNGYPNWYSTYVDYAIANDLIESSYGAYTPAQMNTAVTRAEFVHIFYAAAGKLPAINTIADGAIPDVRTGDVYAAEIYDFYRAGILTGSDAKGTFKPADTIKRSEVAAILVRMYDSGSRVPQTF